MLLDDGEIGTRDLELLKKQLPYGDPRRRDIAETVRIQKLLRNPELAVEWNRKGKTKDGQLEMNGPDELVQEVKAWFTKNWDDLVHLMEIEDED